VPEDFPDHPRLGDERDVDELRAAFPEAALLLKPGEYLASSDFQTVRIEVCLRALRCALPSSEAPTQGARRRLVAASYVRLGGQILALLGSGSVLGSLKLGVFPGVFSFIAAAIDLMWGLSHLSPNSWCPVFTGKAKDSARPIDSSFLPVARRAHWSIPCPCGRRRQDPGLSRRNVMQWSRARTKCADNWGASPACYRRP